jgi:hypothetical protein
MRTMTDISRTSASPVVQAPESPQSHQRPTIEQSAQQSETEITPTTSTATLPVDADKLSQVVPSSGPIVTRSKLTWFGQLVEFVKVKAGLIKGGPHE